MFETTSKTLISLAALVWYTGVVVLIIKSGSLLYEAVKGGVNYLFIFLAVLSGIAIGKIKARYLFYNIGRKNIGRIQSLKYPKLWQFYRKRFFFFLCLMIVSGKYLASAAHGNNSALIALAVLELSIAFALALSSYCFRTKQ